MAIAQNPNAAMHTKGLGQMLREDLAAVGKSILLLFTHLLSPLAKKLDRVSSAVKKEIALYRHQRYVSSHAAEIREAREDLKEKTATAVRYNYQGQDWQHASFSLTKKPPHRICKGAPWGFYLPRKYTMWRIREESISPLTYVRFSIHLRRCESQQPFKHKEQSMTTAILVGDTINRVIGAIKHDLAMIRDSRSEFIPNAHGGLAMNPHYNQRNFKILRMPRFIWNWL